MAVLSLADAHLAYGHVPLLDGAAFALESGERVGLIGRNGTGKSSLLKVLAGIEPLDDGLLQVQQGLRSVYVPQEPAFDAAATVFEVVSSTRCRRFWRRSTAGPGSSASRRPCTGSDSTARASSPRCRAG